jgi:triacylglycerol lipase
MSWLVELDQAKYDIAGDVFRDFDPGPRDYLLANARASGWFSQLAYESDTDKINRILASYRMNLVQKISRASPTILPLTDTKCLIASGRGATMIAFGGTDPVNFANWITDFSFKPTQDVHGGFRAAIDIVAKDIMDAASAAKKDGNAVVMTGHSLGGALAVLAASRLYDNGLPPQSVYTFGMPRVGQQIFADGYNAALGERTFRLRHGDDVVPLVPLPVMGPYAFRHVGRFLQIDRFTRFYGHAPTPNSATNDPEPASALLENFQTSLRNFISGGFISDVEAANNGLRYTTLPIGIGDHLPDRYLLALG